MYLCMSIPVPPVVLPMILFAGFLVDTSTVPSFLSWLEHVSLVRYSYMIMTILEFRQWDIKCPKAITTTTPTMSCHFPSYESVLTSIGTDAEGLAPAIMALCGLGLAYLILGYVALSLTVPRTRAAKQGVEKIKCPDRTMSLSGAFSR